MLRPNGGGKNVQNSPFGSTDWTWFSQRMYQRDTISKISFGTKSLIIKSEETTIVTCSELQNTTEHRTALN